MTAASPDRIDPLADAGALDMIERLSPYLRAQAAFRLGPLRSLYDPEDVVQDAWVRALPYLGDFAVQAAPRRAVALRFLAVTLRNRVRDLHDKHRASQGLASQELSRFHASQSGVVTRAARREHANQLERALLALGDDDRAVVVLRGIEQRAHRDVAHELAIDEETAKKRYQRALHRLRAALPDGLADDLGE